MKNGIKFPYGVSDYNDLIAQGYYYVDRTDYIERMERLGEKYLFFFRPRRFGKSLLVSMLEHYYGREHRDSFEELFGQYYIGQHKTKLAGNYLVLRFNFSGIDTGTKESTYKQFLKKVKNGVQDMMNRFKDSFSEADREAIEAQEAPNEVIGALFQIMRANEISEKLFVLIDEYDHFTNELMAFRLSEFKDSVGKNGYIRKYYERLKEGAETGFIDRMFMTGVSPVTLDSMTSGFNIGMNISKEPAFLEMAGFTEEELSDLLQLLPLPNGDSLERLLPELEKWYDGYRFDEEMEKGLYNPTLALYFCSKYFANGSFPKNMLDTNLSSDYSKIRQLFSLQVPERNYSILREILENETVESELTNEFSFEKEFTREDFISLLFYLGHLTFAPSQPGFLEFKVPNYVIKKLFLDYYYFLLRERDLIPVTTDIIRPAMKELARVGNPRPFFDFIQNILQHLSNRDYQEFSEKHIKVIILSTAMQSPVYFVKSEREVMGGYTDLQFLQKPSVQVNFQYVFELKYVKKMDAATLPLVQIEARKQLEAYLISEPELNQLTNLQAWTVVVVKDEIVLEQIR